MCVYGGVQVMTCVCVCRAYGNCCANKCANGYHTRETACACVCPPGLVGLLCDRTAPHLLLTVTVFNKTRDDWWVTSSATIGTGQTSNEHLVTSNLARVLGVMSARVELGFARAQTQLGTGAQSDAIKVNSRTDAPKSAANRRVADHCVGAQQVRLLPPESAENASSRIYPRTKGGTILDGVCGRP